MLLLTEKQHRLVTLRKHTLTRDRICTADRQNPDLRLRRLFGAPDGRRARRHRQLLRDPEQTAVPLRFYASLLFLSFNLFYIFFLFPSFFCDQVFQENLEKLCSGWVICTTVDV